MYKEQGFSLMWERPFIFLLYITAAKLNTL